MELECSVVCTLIMRERWQVYLPGTIGVLAICQLLLPAPALGNSSQDLEISIKHNKYFQFLLKYFLPAKYFPPWSSLVQSDLGLAPRLTALSQET